MHFILYQLLPHYLSDADQTSLLCVNREASHLLSTLKYVKSYHIKHIPDAKRSQCDHVRIKYYSNLQDMKTLNCTKLHIYYDLRYVLTNENQITFALPSKMQRMRIDFSGSTNRPCFDHCQCTLIQPQNQLKHLYLNIQHDNYTFKVGSNFEFQTHFKKYCITFNEGLKTLWDNSIDNPPDHLPTSLKILRLFCSPSSFDFFPFVNLRILEFDSYFEPVQCWPPHLKKLIIHDGIIPCHNLPDTLTYYFHSLDYESNAMLVCSELPRRLKTLILSRHIDVNCTWPETLKYLSLGTCQKMNYDLPNSVRVLELNHVIYPFRMPSNLKSLQMPNVTFNPSIDKTWPESLKYLYLPNYNMPDEEKLNLSCEFSRHKFKYKYHFFNWP